MASSASSDIILYVCCCVFVVIIICCVVSVVGGFSIIDLLNPVKWFESIFQTGCSSSENQSLDDNQTCDRNCLCKNGACGRKTADDNATLVCCPSGSTKTYAGYDYCGDMPDGSTCWSDAMCSSGYCRDNGGGTRKGKCGKGNAGDACGINNDCLNGSCGRATADDNAELACCASGKTVMYGGYDYCGDMPDESTCWSDSMCASGYCRDNGGGTRKGKCGKGKVGDGCGINNDCANGSCGRATADDDAPLACCASGKIVTYGGYDYCGDMPDGSTCWSDSMCSSGMCDGNAGGTTKGKCKAKKNVGESCSSNSDCVNNSCGRATADDNASLSCCASGKTVTYGGYDYCASMADGSTCWSDSMCSSGYCRDNGGGTRKGKCGKGAVGDTCGINNDCSNKSCGRASADDNAPLSCCASGKTVTYGGYDYCGNMPDGTTCWSDSMCASGTCDGNAGGTKKGKCKTKKNVGDSCSSNNDCLNNSCGRATADDNASLGCCASGKTVTYAGYDYCGNMPDGTTCWSDSMCASGTCDGNAGGTKKGKCKTKKNVGASCSSNSDCLNNSCGRATADDNASITCCASGKIVTYGGYDYCASMPDGSTCWSDSMCASGTCDGNAGGTKKGKCKSKQGAGGSCSSNSDCSNNACGRASAASGTPLTCCASGKTGTYGGYDYCYKMAKGTVCWSDAMCASGTCSGNLGGLQRGNCT